jgi:hypothetical protein
VSQTAKDLFRQEAGVQTASAYLERGLAKQLKSDLNGAIADYDQAIKLNRNFAPLYINRGNVKRLTMKISARCGIGSLA